MNSEDICEIKTIRSDIISEIKNKMENTDSIGKICNLFKILGDVNRVKIIMALQYEELCVCELSLILDMSQSSVSHQLRQLRNSNIVKFRKNNKHVFYSLADKYILTILNEGGDFVNKSKS